MKRWRKLDPDHDLPDLAGYNVAGTVRYIDRDAFRALTDPEYAKHILGEEIDTGLTPEQTIQLWLQYRVHAAIVRIRISKGEERPTVAIDPFGLGGASALAALAVPPEI